MPDPRFDTPAMFSAEEAREIKRLIAERSPKVHCPRCDLQLMFGTPITRSGLTIFPVRCPKCNRSVMIREKVR